MYDQGNPTLVPLVPSRAPTCSTTLTTFRTPRTNLLADVVVIVPALHNTKTLLLSRYLKLSAVILVLFSAITLSIDISASL
jgi:hypothetical protein